MNTGQIAAEAVSDAFMGRKGHGGGKCTRRVLRPHQLKAIIQTAIEKALSSLTNDHATIQPSTGQIAAAEAAKEISDWEAKEYGKPAYAFASQAKEIEVITAIVKTAIKKATKFYQDHIDIYVEDNRKLRAAHASEVPPAKHVQIRVDEPFPMFIALRRGSETKEYVLSQTACHNSD